MNELILSNNLSQIEQEIRQEKERIGKSVWEIGRRLKHVKDNDLVHGQFMDWYQGLGFNKNFVSKAITIAESLSNFPTLGNIGTEALYLIASLPDEEQAEQLDRIEQGDNPTVRELQELKKQLNEKNKQLIEVQADILSKDFEIRQLKEREPTVIEKEVVPQDYDSVKNLNKNLLERNKELYSSLEEKEKEIEQLLSERENVQKETERYEELTRSIQQTKQELSDYKTVLNVIRAGDELLVKMAALVYADETKFRNADEVIGLEIDSLLNRMQMIIDDLNRCRGRNKDVIEGVFTDGK